MKEINPEVSQNFSGSEYSHRVEILILFKFSQKSLTRPNQGTTFDTRMILAQRPTDQDRSDQADTDKDQIFKKNLVPSWAGPGPSKTETTERT